MTKENTFDDWSRKEEQQAGKSPYVLLPAVVLTRLQIDSNSDWSHSRSVHSNPNVLLSSSTTTGEARTVTMCWTRIDYSLTFYTSKFSSLNKLTLNWLMNAGRRLTSFSIGLEDLDDEEFDVTLAFQPPESVKTSRFEAEDEKGPIFAQAFPFSIDTTVVPTCAGCQDHPCC